MFGQFGREAAFRIFSHKVRKILAGSGFQDIFPQSSQKSGGKWLSGYFPIIFSDNSGGKQLSGYFPTIFGQFRREAAFRFCFHNFRKKSGGKRLSGYFPTMFAKFGREVAFRIFSHNFRTIPAGSGFQIRAGSGFEDNFPQCSENSGGKRLSGSVPTIFGKIPAGSGFQDIFPQCSQNSGGKRL